MTIGERIKERREELGMTQDQLAEALGYSSRSTIAKIESGKNELSQTRIVDFANVLKVTPAYIMGWIEDKSEDEDLDGIDKIINDTDRKLRHFNLDYSAFERAIVEATRKLDDNGKDELETFLEYLIERSKKNKEK